LTLSSSDRLLLRLFAACALGDWEELTRARLEAGPGEPDRRWREAYLQVHLFAGIPRQVEAGQVLAHAGGLGDPDPDEIEGAGSPSFDGRGLALFERIYRDNAGAVRGKLARAHPDFERWVLEHAYGRVLSRPGLPADRRELLAVVALAALGQERQFASHARGALHCGATAEELEAALALIEDPVERRYPGRIGEARRMLARLT
jgi:alkylhydroperoxidase/carboxymuconolactone decarboxylase family protein YurZ